MEVTKNDSIVWKQKLIEILKFVISICDEYSIRYYICYGSAIGVVRHEGFIPWDDDIDIFIPRPDYIKFQKILIERNDPNYEFFSYSTNESYIQPMGKVVDKHTTLLELDSQNYVEGLYIDVFPLDGCSDSFDIFMKDMVRYRHLYLKMQVLNEPLNYRVIRSIWRMIKKKNFYFLRYLPYYSIRPFLRRESLLSKMETIENKYSYDESTHVACYSGAYKGKEYCLKSWFGKGREMYFEGVKVLMPDNYDAYLNHLYGDYMKLPPESKRVSHHFAAYYNLNERISLQEACSYIQ